ncbi:serine protease HTRA2, mitochondrial [Polistes fuscatus]|uniref:serine protease HTRA2, mitochondrial n=1 Tax=Polistes fuscatus TaxID=30207 RepID=UPI001CA90795|nr:serine protease HTRA2, mitochondrial [Polistes fuscatus]
MTVLLSRVSFNILKKEYLSHVRPAIFLNADQLNQVRSNHLCRQENRINTRSGKHLLTYTLVISGISYFLYKKRNDLYERFRDLNIGMPTVRSATIIPNLVDYRERYNFIADVVAVSAPSVVYIEISNDKKLDMFTGRPIGASTGCGFIVSSDGLILTNAHVVMRRRNSKVKVRLHDGTVYNGIIEDVDMQNDLATLRINKKDLPVMKLGNSSDIRPGEFVIAIGSPLSLSNTITSGVVSSTNRPSEELGLDKNIKYIQTDAAITYGNSGGPLVNLNGEAIGINAMKVTAGISFAIPIDCAKEFLKKAEIRRKNKGKLPDPIETHKRRYMGITMLTISPDIIFELQDKRGYSLDMIKHGVFVWRVITGSPAYKSGVQAGDIITHVNGEPVFAAVNIYKALESSGSLKLTVIRHRDVLVITVDPED